VPDIDEFILCAKGPLNSPFFEVPDIDEFIISPYFYNNLVKRLYVDPFLM